MDYNALIKAVKEHGDLNDQELIDAANHGAATGWSGFSYYKDTVAFYDKHEQLIWELLEHCAEEFGTTPLKLVGNFQCAESIVDMSTFKNALAWFALEEAGRALINRQEGEK